VAEEKVAPKQVPPLNLSAWNVSDTSVFDSYYSNALLSTTCKWMHRKLCLKQLYHINRTAWNWQIWFVLSLLMKTSVLL